MHWFWRATLAIIYGTVLGLAFTAALFRLGWPSTSVPFLISLAIATFGVLIVPQMIAIRAYLILTRRYVPQRRTDETCCRKCGHILRGISEPRCPECGERI